MDGAKRKEKEKSSSVPAGWQLGSELERHPLREKAILGCMDCTQCFVCAKPRTIWAGTKENGDNEWAATDYLVSDVTPVPVGFKYVGGVLKMLTKDAVSSAISVYADEVFDQACCECTAFPTSRLAPIGTLFSSTRPFDPVLGVRKELRMLAPSFTEYSPYAISIERVLRGMDTRTTCMIKNIPNKLTTKQLVTFLSSICYNSFDFVYLRMDFKSNCNNGYAFINFRAPAYIPIFLEAIQGRRWKHFRSEKRGEITYARIQGMQMLHNRFKRSDILAASRDFWPILFNARGEEVPANTWSVGGSRNEERRRE